MVELKPQRLSFLPKHAKEVFKSLQKQSILIVEGPNGEKIRKNSFYIDYQFLKSKEKKAIFRIK